MNAIHALEKFLEGDTETIVADLQKNMQHFSDMHQYENAAKARDQLHDIQHVVSRQRVVSPKNTSYDVIHLVRSASEAFINLFLIRNGKLLGRQNFSVHFADGTSEQEVLTSFVKQFYQKTQNFPKEILVPVALTEQDGIEEWIAARAQTLGTKWRVRITVPEKGEKKKLLLMSRENAEEYQKRVGMLAQAKLTNIKDALANIAHAVGLEKPPHRIEIYDMSNIQGTNAVGSMVVFTDGESDKKQYRRFRVRTFSTPNDVGMMTEVLIRRLSRLKKDKGNDAKWPRPDLIVLDGGKPQHKAAREAFKAVGFTVPFISLAKREEEVVVPGRERSIIFPRDSQELFLMQRMRDEAHRFAITYHRNLRSKKAYQSQLDEIPGLGPKSKKKLLREIGSVKAISSASHEELSKVVGTKLAFTIKEYL
jgi:excinuclease ABC subunit C